MEPQSDIKQDKNHERFFKKQGKLQCIFAFNRTAEPVFLSPLAGVCKGESGTGGGGRGEDAQ